MATANNTIKTRIQLKSDTEANWNKAGPKDGSAGFVPLMGELIVYTADEAHPFSRLKVGDGNTNVVNLPFIDAGTINGSLLPEAVVEFYTTRNAFPSPGTANKLYIDVATQTIYSYTNASGYTPFYNFTCETSNVSQIVNWSAGRMTSASNRDGILKIRNGSEPQLDYVNFPAVVNITRGGN